MATFGHYSTQVLLHKKGLNSVYSAVSAARPGKEFAVKVFQLPSFLEEETRNQAEAFLDSAKVQQRIASTGARYWAPVYEQGSAPEGAYYATDKYACSAQELIDGHVKLSAGALHNIVTSVVNGLLELKKALGRPHGNLKPSNILISQHSDLSNAEVVLCDPVASRHLDPEVHWAADVRDVAELIYQLVMHNSSPMLDNRQIPPSDQWRALGKTGDNWRGLCSRLISAALQRTSKDLAQLAEELAAMEPKAKSPLARKWLIIAAALAVTLTAITIWILRPKKPPINIEGNKKWINYLHYKRNEKQLPVAFRSKLEGVFDSLFNDPCVTTDEQKTGPIKEFRAYLGDYGYDEEKGDWSAKYKDDVWPRLVLVNDAAKRFKGPFQTAYDTLHSWRKGVKPPVTLAESEGYDIAESIANNIQEIISIDNRVLDKELMVRWDVNIPGRCAELQEMKASADPNLVLQVNELLREINDKNAIASKKLNETAFYIDGIYDRCVNLRLGLMNITSAEGRRKWISETLGSVEFRVPILHKAWLAYTKNVLAESRHAELVNNLDNFTKVKTQVEDVKVDLEKSRDELVKAVEALTPGQSAWYDKLKGIATPSGDPNAENTKRFCEDWAKEGPQIAKVLNSVETWFNACYLLDDTPLDSKDLAVRDVFDGGIGILNKFVSDANSQPKELKVLISRVDRLNEIASLSRSELVTMADPNDPNSHPEAMYAAWLELQKKSPEWPADESEWKKDKDIRERLREIVREIKGSDSKQAEKLEKAAEDKIDPQVSSLRKSIASRAERIIEKASVDPNNVIFVKLVHPLTEVARVENEAAELKDIDNLAKDMNDFIAGSNSNWPDNYRTDLLVNDPVLQPDRLRNTNVGNWREILGNWRQIVDQYEVVVPSEKSECEKILGEIDKLRTEKDTIGKNDPEYAANITKHNTANETFNEIAGVPTVRKHIAGIENAYSKLQKDLEAIRVYFKEYQPGNSLLTLDAGGRVIFKSTIRLSAFYPVVPDQTQRSFARPTTTHYQPRGWPTYIASTGDPSVIFGFIPGEPTLKINDFYISLHEITNEQYLKLLDWRDNGVPAVRVLLAGRKITRGADVLWQPDAGHDYRTTIGNKQINSKEVNGPKMNHPVTWGTYEGARCYAEDFLDANLPTVEQYKRVLETLGKTGGVAGSYDHVRGDAWRQQADKWNRQRGTQTPVSIPLDAADSGWEIDDLKTIALDTDDIFAGGEQDEPPWPRSVGDYSDSGLRDLIGNVWEWCNGGKTIYGGSCLSPPGRNDKTRLLSPMAENISPNLRRCDLGFRVAVTVGNR